jgi:squalene-hopene/tetraprenyl-beta-curcumene cyclase
MIRCSAYSMALLAGVAVARAAVAGDADAATTRNRTAIQRGLVFLENDVVKWRKERKCSTCHHGTMTVWAYSEAKRQGYTVKPESAADTIKWAKERFMERVDKPRDKRPGWSMVNTPAIYFALTAQFVPGQDAISENDLKRIAGHLLRHQEADGAWAWSAAPPKNRPPPFFESDEVATRLAYMALRPHVPADAKTKSAARDSRSKAAEWLNKTKPADTTQAAALRLLMTVRAGAPADTMKADVAKFLQRQNKDGGWGQLPGLPSDSYATGQALYVLRLAGMKRDRKELQRGVAFLVASQRPDGSWPIKPRFHPGATPAKFTVPITYFGSAWATLGLMRCVPAAGKE